MTESDPVADGTVVLDIGGDVGALIIHTRAELRGYEIEIRPLDAGAEDVFQAEHPHVPEDEHTHNEHEHGEHSHTHDGHTHTHGGHTHAHTPGTTHVAVLERPGPDGSRFAAVYPGLREGRYSVLRPDGPHEDVRITGGEVAELDWS